MKKIYHHTLFLVIFLNSLVAFSAQVSESMAKNVAFNFVKNIDSRVSSSSLSLVNIREGAFYIFGYEAGWVIVSSDDRAMPILGYSTEGAFPKDTIRSERGDNFWGQMLSYENQIKYAVENNISATYDISSQWENLKNGQSTHNTTTVVPPLLTTAWDQGWPYNSMCPSDASGPGGHVWVGCVATAMSQIMKYHNYPSQGLGSYGYQWGSYPYTGANFGATTYNWSNMPNSISTVNNDIATIMYQTAVSCRSMWGPGNTGVGYSSDSDPMTRAFVNYFKAAYSTIQYVESQYYTTTQWNNIIQTELTNNRPVYYRGDGIGSHAWVCDGVDASNMYHFNWGWGGQYNGYFALTAITPGSFNFTSNQHAIIGIKPNDGSTLVTNTTWSGNITKSTNVAVPDAITLTVNPGTIASFSQNCKLQIWGKLTSIGTSSNYAKFTAVDTTTGWLGIKWDNSHMNGEVMADNDSSKLIYTQVEYSDERGIYCRYYSKVVVDYCKINNNYSSDWGGGIFADKPINITRTNIYNNHATIGGGGIFLSGNDNMSSTINQNDIHNNFSAGTGGGFLLNGTINILFKENIIHNNQSIEGAGGGLWGASSSLIINNKFCNNSTIGYTGRGGGLYIANCSANVVDNLFTNNTKSGLYITTNSNPILLNNTISNNSEPNYGGGVRIMYNSNPIFKNTILYGNTAPDGSQISLETTDCDPFFDHCDIQGGLSGFGGVGAGANYIGANYTNNIDLNPIYVSPSGGAGNGYDGLVANWQLQSTSPCINAGDTTGVSNLLPALDLGGNPRINGIIDMGAYEACSGPAQPSIITGSTTPCQNSTQTYSVTNIAGVTYTWTVPTGSTIGNGQGSNAVTVTIGATSGNISVTPSNACGNGTSRTLAITVNTLPTQPSTITGVSNPCQGASETYSVSIVAGQTYNWAVPSGWTISSGQGTFSIIAVVGATSGNISVTPSNACGNGPSQSKAVVVNVVPVQPSAIAGNTTPCQNSSQNYSVNSVTNVSYAWSVPSGWTITSGQGSNLISVSVGSTDGNIIVVPSNACGSGTSTSMAVTVNFVLTDAGTDQTVAYGNSTILSGNASNGSGDYSWSWTPAELLVDATVQNPTTLTLTSSTVFTLTVSDAQTGCSDVDEMTVTVTGGPLGVTASATPEAVCAGESSQLYALVSGGSGNYTYNWTSDPAGYTSDLQNPVVYPSITTSYFVSVNDGSSTVTDDAQVFVSSFPAIPAMPAGPDTVDIKYITESQYTIAAVENATSYLWDLSPTNAGTITGSGLTANVVWNFDFLGDAFIKTNAMNECGESEWSVEKQTFVENTVGIVSKPVCDLVVYPNPVSGDKIVISFCYKMERIDIFDMKGITLISKLAESENYSLTHQLPSGVYFIKMVYSDGIIVKKIVVE